MTVHTVTSENAEEFYAARLPKRADPVPVDDAPKGEAETKAESESNTHEKARKPIQPRINELVAERNSARDEAERERLEKEQAKRELDDLKKRLEVLETPAEQKAVSDRPTRSQFATDDDYQEALTDWKVEKRLAEQAAQEAEARQRAAQAQMVENWKARLEEARKGTEDFDTVVGAAETVLHQAVLDAIVESEAGPQITYYLAKNPAEAKRIAGLRPSSGAREIGKLEAQLTQGKPTAKPVSVEKSKAPEPIEPLKGVSSQIGKDRKDMTYDEWKAARQAGRIQ